MCLQNGGVTMVLIFANAIMCCLSSGSSFILWGKAIFPHWFRNISTGLHLGYRTLQCMVSCFAICNILIWGRGDSRQVAERGHCSNSACKTGWWTCCAPWMNNFKYMLLARSVYLTLLGVCLQGKHVLRLRASIFVNLAAMRSCMSKNRNQGCLLSAENLSILCRSNYLFHSALNSFVGCKKRLVHDVVQDFLQAIGYRAFVVDSRCKA